MIETCRGYFNRLLAGGEITYTEALEIAGLDAAHDEEIIEVAHELTKRVWQGRVSFCSILPAKRGLCGEDCAFCAQSVHHNCDIDPIALDDWDLQDILRYVRAMQAHGVDRFSLVTSGERLSVQDFDKTLAIYDAIRSEIDIELCASLGSLDAERARMLKERGITRYHHNVETARAFFPSICSTHLYEDKLETIALAKSAGLSVCSGGIFSMGESMEQRIQMAFELKALQVDCVPINILSPIPGTALEHQVLPPARELLRSIALFRLILPRIDLRFAGGRQGALKDLEYEGYRAGINSAIIGDFLTLNGTDCTEEIKQIRARGFKPVRIT